MRFFFDVAHRKSNAHDYHGKFLDSEEERAKLPKPFHMTWLAPKRRSTAKQAFKFGMLPD